MKRFYFTSDSHCDGDNLCNDHLGNIRGARTIAQKLANELNETVYINDFKTNSIVDCVDPDSLLDDAVDNTLSLTFDELILLKVLVKSRISVCEDCLSSYRSSGIGSNEEAAYYEKEISSSNLLAQKLDFLSMDALKKLM